MIMGNNEFKLNRETFSALTVVLENSLEQSVEKDFVLPDYYPDIFRILKCSVIPRIVSHTVNDEKITIEIAVLVRVLYLSENDKAIHSIEQKLNFAKTADLNGKCENPMIQAKAQCDYANCRVVNRRRLDVRGSVTTYVKVTSEVKSQIVSDAFGGGIQLKKQIVNYPTKRLNALKRVTVIEELQLAPSKPSVSAIIDVDCSVIVGDKKIIAGKLITKGEAEITMLYTCVDSSGEAGVESMKFNIPFSQIIDVDGIDETFDACVDIEPGGCEIIPKGEQGEKLECEINLLVSCRAVKYETCEIVKDAYSTQCQCQLKSCEGKIDLPPREINVQKTIEGEISYEEGEIDRVYSCHGECLGISSRLKEDGTGFCVMGNLKISILGCSKDKLPFFTQKEIPFEYQVQLPEDFSKGEGDYQPAAEVISCSYYLAGEKAIQIKGDIKLGGRIMRQCSGELLSDIILDTNSPKEKSENFAIKLCRVTKDDDIWEIAKRYSTCVSAIMEENELSDDKITQQGMLLIPLMN